MQTSVSRQSDLVFYLGVIYLGVLALAPNSLHSGFLFRMLSLCVIVCMVSCLLRSRAKIKEKFYGGIWVLILFIAVIVFSISLSIISPHHLEENKSFYLRATYVLMVLGILNWNRHIEKIDQEA